MESVEIAEVIVIVITAMIVVVGKKILEAVYGRPIKNKQIEITAYKIQKQQRLIDYNI